MPSSNSDLTHNFSFRSCRFAGRVVFRQELGLDGNFVHPDKHISSDAVDMVPASLREHLLPRIVLRC